MKNSQCSPRVFNANPSDTPGVDAPGVDAPGVDALPQLTVRWFVIYTHARSERQVHAKLVEMGLNAFLPLRTIRRKTRRGMRNLEVPLFSNYVFVQTTPNRIASLSKIPGLAQLVSFGGKPAPVSDEEIEAIRRTCTGSFQGKVGDQIVVVRGNATGTRGTVIGRPNQRQLIVQPSDGPSTIPIGVEADQVRAA